MYSLKNPTFVCFWTSRVYQIFLARFEYVVWYWTQNGYKTCNFFIYWGKIDHFKILSTPSPQFNVDGQRFMKNIQKSDIMNLDVFIKKMTTSYFLYVLRKIRSSSQHWIGGKGLKNCIYWCKNDYFLLYPLKERKNEIVLKYFVHREIFSENQHSFYVVRDFRFFIFI